jgi:hypothetical protein
MKFVSIGLIGGGHSHVDQADSGGVMLEAQMLMQGKTWHSKASSGGWPQSHLARAKGRSCTVGVCERHLGCSASSCVWSFSIAAAYLGHSRNAFMTSASLGAVKLGLSVDRELTCCFRKAAWMRDRHSLTVVCMYFEESLGQSWDDSEGGVIIPQNRLDVKAVALAVLLK